MLSVYHASSVTYSEQSSISDVFDAVENGSVTYGVIPFENSTYGTVKITMDRLLTCHKAQIRAESNLKISHSLLSTCQSIGSIKRIYSHQEAFGQCARWYSLQSRIIYDVSFRLAVNMKGVELIEVSSTAYAAQLASKENDTAAICSVGCASIYGLNVVRNHVEDITSTYYSILISE